MAQVRTLLSPNLRSCFRGHHRLEWLIWFGAYVALGWAMAVAIAILPAIAVSVGFLIVLWGFYSQRPLLRINAVTGGLLGALLVFGYGFANVGVRVGQLPLPLAELVLLCLLGLIGRHQRQLPARIAVPLLVFLTFVAARLIADYPVWGNAAIRDATLAVDSLALVVGFALVQLGLTQSFISLLKRISIATLIYGSLFPWRERLADFGPTVGLQQEVPLLGSMSGIGVAVGGAFIFFAVFCRGPQRIILMAWALAVVALLQARGLYLAIPLALTVMRMVGGLASRRILYRGGTALLICLVGLLSLSPLDLDGRLGQLSPSFYLSHVATLFGTEGPGAGSLAHRLAMTEGALQEFRRTPVTIIFGAGLGPDLAAGFSADGPTLVRKPHNDFLEILVRLGLLGAGVFLWLLFALMRPIVRCARHAVAEGTAPILCTWVLGVATLYLLIASTQPLLAYPFGAIPLFLFLGIGCGVAFLVSGSKAALASGTNTVPYARSPRTVTDKL